jgi:hypothetical protein
MCAKRTEARNIEKVQSAEYSGHYSQFQTQAKVLSGRFFWPELHEDILKDMLHHAPNAKEPETFLKGMPCL